MKKSGLADSPFFSKPKAASLENEQPVVGATANTGEEKSTETESADTVVVTTAQRHDDANQVAERDTTISGYHDTIVAVDHEAMVEEIRRAVKEYGKEAATHRFTAAEKDAIDEIIYTCKRSGIRTSENEIARIAINYTVHDYALNGEDSLLMQVLQALNA